MLPRPLALRLQATPVWARAVAAVALLLGALLLALACFDWGLLKGTIERRLTARFGRPVHIARAVREGGPSLRPLLVLDGVTIGQPAWVGPATPPFASIRHAAIRFSVPALLLGRFSPLSVEVEGAQVALRRDADGRRNWGGGGDTKGRKVGAWLSRLHIADATIRLDDRQRDRRFEVTAEVDPLKGVAVAGGGTIRGAPIRVEARGAALFPAPADGWPFRARFTGPTLRLDVAGRTASPLDTAHLTGTAAASGRDLRDLDAIVDAGLPATQPFRLAADIRHDAPAWTIGKLHGTVGRSDVAGDIAVTKRGDRSHIDATIRSNAADLDDLASDEGLAEAAALARRLGKRMLPPTRIDLAKLRGTDGTLRFAIRRLLWKTPQPFTGASGTATLDHGTLRITGLAVATAGGRLTGTMTVVHPAGRPRLTLDLRLAGARLGTLVGTDQVASTASGRVRVTGEGETIREAVGHGRGAIALVGRGGTIDRRSAEALGGNIGRALGAGAGERVGLNCVIARFAGSGGRFAPAPLVIDTAVSRADGHGRLDLATERLALTLPARSKVESAFRLSAPLEVTGTVGLPSIRPAAAATSTGGILKTIGRALSGHKEPAAVPADCARLAAAALR